VYKVLVPVGKTKSRKKLKMKLSLWLIKHHAMKMYLLDGGEWSG
jgi:hypothetical protein